VRNSLASRPHCTDRLLPDHLDAMAARPTGRTKALGGQVSQGTACGASAYRSHAWKHRPCPTGQHAAATRWRAQPRALLLPGPSCLVPFPLPAALRPVARAPQPCLDTLLLQTAAAAWQAHAAWWGASTHGQGTGPPIRLSMPSCPAGPWPQKARRGSHPARRPGSCPSGRAPGSAGARARRRWPPRASALLCRPRAGTRTGGPTAHRRAPARRSSPPAPPPSPRWPSPPSAETRAQTDTSRAASQSDAAPGGNVCRGPPPTGAAPAQARRGPPCGGHWSSWCVSRPTPRNRHRARARGPSSRVALPAALARAQAGATLSVPPHRTSLACARLPCRGLSPSPPPRGYCARQDGIDVGLRPLAAPLRSVNPPLSAGAGRGLSPPGASRRIQPAGPQVPLADGPRLGTVRKPRSLAPNGQA